MLNKSQVGRTGGQGEVTEAGGWSGVSGYRKVSGWVGRWVGTERRW